MVADPEATRPDRLEGPRRIGIDELSYRVGQRSITVVVDHDTGRLVWAREGRDRETVQAFFDLLGAERTSRIEAVSSDLGAWITRQVAASCPDAALCTDPFHVVRLATDALDVVRRETWNDARRAGDKQAAGWLKGARYAVWKNPENRTGRQRAKLATIQQTNKRLYRAYLLKEQLRAVFHADNAAAAINDPRRLAGLGAPLAADELRQDANDSDPAGRPDDAPPARQGGAPHRREHRHATHITRRSSINRRAGGCPRPR